MALNEKTQLEKAKGMAYLFLQLPIEKAEIPFCVYHPIFDSPVIYFNGEMIDVLDEKNTEIFEQYKLLYKEKVIDTCESVNEIICTVIRNPYILAYLKFLYKDKILTACEIGYYLAKNWSSIEFISKDSNVSKKQILNWLKVVDKKELMQKEEWEKYNSFSDTITIYRGCNSKQAIRNLSWTTDKSKAIWFARRFLTAHKKGYLCTASIKKNDIMFYTNRYGENEVVIDYSKLQDLQIETIKTNIR